jgi:hypothetical protein
MFLAQRFLRCLAIWLMMLPSIVSQLFKLQAIRYSRTQSNIPEAGCIQISATDLYNVLSSTAENDSNSLTVNRTSLPNLLQRKYTRVTWGDTRRYVLKLANVEQATNASVEAALTATFEDARTFWEGQVQGNGKRSHVRSNVYRNARSASITSNHVQRALVATTSVY